MPDILNSVCNFFADDSKLYKSIQDPADQDSIHKDLMYICDWNEKMAITVQFSIPKCKVIQYEQIKLWVY